MLNVVVFGGTREGSENLRASIVLAGHNAKYCEDLIALSKALQSAAPTVIGLDLTSTINIVDVFTVLTKCRHEVSSIFSIGDDMRLTEALSRSARAHGFHVLGELLHSFSTDQLKTLLSDHPLQATSLVQHTPVKVSLSKTDLLKALEHNYFYQVYQPQVCLQTGRVVGFETLCRLKSPSLRQISPDYFIPLCEHFELIDELTKIIINESIRWFAGFIQQYQHVLAEQCMLSINISATNLQKIEVFNQLRSCCKQHRLAHSRIKLELTETAEVKDQLKCLDLLTELRLEGFELSIDDFGSGFSSLQQLLNLPFSELKLEKKITQAASYSKESRVVLQSIISMAHVLGMFVVAEGVEDKTQLQLLADMQCDAAQGFYLAHPMTASEVECWLINFTKAELSEAFATITMR